MKIMDSIYKFFGFEGEDKAVVKKKKKRSTKSAMYNLKKDKKLEDNINGVDVYYPENLEEAKEYVSMTRNNISYFLDFKFTPSAEKEKILDFLNGALTVLEANIHEVKKGKLYIVLPKGVELENIDTDRI